MNLNLTALLLAALCSSTSEAFSPRSLGISGFQQQSQAVPTPTPTPLYMANEEGAGEEEAVAAENPAAEEAAPAEDPEVTALKEEIANLESELKSKKSNLQYQLDQAEEYSKTGYARSVAEMENMRRARTSMASSNRSSATAGVLTEFLPVYDAMNVLHEKYAGDEFGGKYSGLSMGATFAKMGVQEFSVQAGELVVNDRMTVVGTEESELPPGSVIQVVRPGLELEGNVIRPLECVASASAAPEESSE